MQYGIPERLPTAISEKVVAMLNLKPISVIKISTVAGEVVAFVYFW